MEKELLTSESDFKTIIKSNGFYIDKTMFIEEVLIGTRIKLFTRPRRFGKTLNLSMLKHFFNNETEKENRELFNNLAVENTKAMEHFGKYPVIFLNFKDIKSDNSKGNLQIVKDMISNLYEDFKYVREILEAGRLEEYNLIMNRKEANYSMAIRNLCEYLFQYYKKEVVLLIDEYDTPLIEAYVNGYYDEVINFYRLLYQSALKDTTYLRLGILTGINRIARENIFSGLNNIKVNSVLSKNFEEYFGFTEKEVLNSLKEYKLENTFNEVKYWYNGYNFNGKKIYNPWSIVNYLSDKELKPHWVNTSENILISQSLENVANDDVFEKLNVLFKGGTIQVDIDETTIFNNLQNPNELWNLMLNSGYLTVGIIDDFDEYELKIPNYEIERFFTKIFIKNFIEDNGNHYMYATRALRDGKLDIFKKELEKNVFETVSIYEKDKEAFYHGYMIGFTSDLKKYYFIESEREAGYGKLDISLEPKKGKIPAHIIEIKVVKEIRNKNKLKEKMKEEVKKALEQIKENKYYANFLKRNIQNINIISIVFCGKRVEVDFEKIK